MCGVGEKRCKKDLLLTRGHQQGKSCVEGEDDTELLAGKTAPPQPGRKVIFHGQQSSFILCVP